MLARFERDRLDIVVVEGFKHATYPKIEVHRPAFGQEPLYPDDSQIIAVASDAPLGVAPHPVVLPLNQPEVIVDFLMARREVLRYPFRGKSTVRLDCDMGAGRGRDPG
jgi:molybdopterin-guanine dinucleotide biosynthesis protein B